MSVKTFLLHYILKKTIKTFFFTNILNISNFLLYSSTSTVRRFPCVPENVAFRGFYQINNIPNLHDLILGSISLILYLLLFLIQQTY